MVEAIASRGAGGEGLRRAVRRRLLHELPQRLLLPALLGALAGATAWWSVAELVASPGPLAALGSIFAVGVAIFCVRAGLWLRAATGRLHVVAYFERRVGCSWALSDGYALHAAWPALERAATALGGPSLDSFGFGDDRLYEPLAWHDAAALGGLLRALRGRLDAEASAALHADLDALLVRLDLAAAQGIRCALHVRLPDDWVSPLEFERRRGFYG